MYNMFISRENHWIISTKANFFLKKYLTGRKGNSIMIKQITRCVGIACNKLKELAEMKSTGIIRKVDDLGRIVLPIELRRTLDIAERDELEIYMENDQIILRKYEPACLFCASDRKLVCYHGKNVCRDCVRKMLEL